jgi:hypothetical protein
VDIGRLATFVENVVMPQVEGVVVRPASLGDAEPICAIYNAAIAEWGSTFETEPRSEGDFAGRIGAERYPLLVVERLLTLSSSARRLD